MQNNIDKMFKRYNPSARYNTERGRSKHNCGVRFTIPEGIPQQSIYRNSAQKAATSPKNFGAKAQKLCEPWWLSAFVASSFGMALPFEGYLLATVFTYL